jgi:thiol:disulfide interchange protein DsbC
MTAKKSNPPVAIQNPLSGKSTTRGVSSYAGVMNRGETTAVKTMRAYAHSLVCLLAAWLLGLGAVAHATDAPPEKVKELVGAIDDSELIIYEPEGDVTHSVVVFTDVNCTHCRLLHARMDEYLEKGVRVKYAAFPVHGDSRRMMEAVWCREDRNAAMDEAKRGVKLEAADCETPVVHHLDIALELSLWGTPAIVTAEGQVLYGYLPGIEVLNVVDESPAKD